MKKINNQSGIAHLALIIVILLVVAISGVGWYVWNKNSNKDSSITPSTVSVAQPEPTDPTPTNQQKEYTIENEGLTFSYNPKITTVTTKKPRIGNGLYVEDVEVKTGSVTLLITAGIDGIGGGAQCIVGDNSLGNKSTTCDVISTKKSTFLNKPVTYRLIKAKQAEECGYDGVPACSVAPLVTSYFLDTGTDTESFGSCCGTVSVKSKNTGKKAKVTGTLLVSIDPAKKIQNKDLLTNTDLLETIKIIESMKY